MVYSVLRRVAGNMAYMDAMPDLMSETVSMGTLGKQAEYDRRRRRKYVISDAMIYRPNDILSRYWPYCIDIVKKNIKISIYRDRFDIVSISEKRRRCCLFIFFFVGNKSIKLWVFTFQVSRHHALLIIIPHTNDTIEKTLKTSNYSMLSYSLLSVDYCRLAYLCRPD